MHDASASEEVYDNDYHAAWFESATRSAAVVVPLLLKHFPWVTSIVDVGCGSAAWLHEFQLRGAARVLGLDAANIPPHLLQVGPAEFQRVDLRGPFSPSERFDLALSLETADCLPEPAAEPFVRHLTEFSDLVVFGAAGPGRSARPNVNERWPSYWIGLFAARGYLCFDILRDAIWYDQRVSWWYAQDTFVFARASRQDLVAPLKSIPQTKGRAFDVVHPRAFELSRLGSGKASANTNAYMLELVEENFHAYNIVRYLGRYWGAPLALGHLNLELETDRARPGVISTTSLDALKETIASYALKFVEENFHGYNIIRYRGCYWGAPLALGHLNLELEADRARPGVISALSLDELKKTITSYALERVEDNFHSYNILRYLGRYWGVPLALGHLNLELEADRAKPGVISAPTMDELKNIIVASLP